MGLELNFRRKSEHAQKLDDGPDHDQPGPDMEPLSHCPLKMKPAIPYSSLLIARRGAADLGKLQLIPKKDALLSIWLICHYGLHVYVVNFTIIMRMCKYEGKAI